MNIKRLFATSFFSLVLAVSAMGANLVAINPAVAQDDPAKPMLVKAEAKNTGGTSAKEAGDSVIIDFSETTNKYALTASNLATELSLSNSHSFLDGAGAVGDIVWSDDGEQLTVILSDATSLPTVAAGDKVSIAGTNIKDLDGNAVTGNATIKGSFTASHDSQDDCTVVPTLNAASRGSDHEDDNSNANSNTNSNVEDNNKPEVEDSNDQNDDCDSSHHGEEKGKFRCGNGLENGHLYKVGDSLTVYLLADCVLKPFRGEAAFHSRGHKFSDVRVLPTLPPNVTTSTDPVVPAEGTLVKGSDKTVWFVAKNGKRKGFTSAQVFAGLGFKFTQVDQISDSDLSTIPTDTAPINTETEHPNGSMIKCNDSPAVFEVIDRLKFPFANAQVFEGRGHRFDHILNVDCNRFGYKQAPAITE
jgi:hypothetical protein